MAGFEASRAGLDEKGIKNEIIMAVDQKRPRLDTPETLLESLRAVGSSEPSAENDETTHVRVPASRPDP